MRRVASSVCQARCCCGARVKVRVRDGDRMKPCRVALVGGGRWARVYATVLSKNPDLAGAVTIISPGNAEGMRSWVAIQALPCQVTAASDASGFDAAIITNAAAAHEAAAERFLKARVPVL